MGAVVARFHASILMRIEQSKTNDAVAMHLSCATATKVRECYHRAIVSAIEFCSDQRHREGMRDIRHFVVYNTVSATECANFKSIKISLIFVNY